MAEIGLADDVRALKNFDCIAVQIEAYRPVGRIVYNKADWAAESRKLSSILATSGLNSANFRRTPLSA